MVVIHKTIFISNIISTSTHLHPHQFNVGVQLKNIIVSRNDEQQSNNNNNNNKKLEKIRQGGKPNFPIKKILTQAGIGVLTLGFIDAGYSGDWSRIGVISKENEDVLKAAAFVLLPISVYLIYLISQQPDEVPK